jgi:hypothetical protein
MLYKSYALIKKNVVRGVKEVAYSEIENDSGGYSTVSQWLIFVFNNCRSCFDVVRFKAIS